MPIITFEYSSNLEIDNKILSFSIRVYSILVEEIKTDLRTCRSSIVKRDNYLIGDGDSNNALKRQFDTVAVRLY